MSIICFLKYGKSSWSPLMRVTSQERWRTDPRDFKLSSSVSLPSSSWPYHLNPVSDIYDERFLFNNCVFETVLKSFIDVCFPVFSHIEMALEALILLRNCFLMNWICLMNINLVLGFVTLVAHVQGEDSLQKAWTLKTYTLYSFTSSVV